MAVAEKRQSGKEIKTMNTKKKYFAWMLACMLFLTTVLTPVSIQAATAKMNHKSLTMYVGDTKTLKVTTTLKGKITWKSSDKKVAAVSGKGKVTAKKAGTATITAKIKTKKVTCKITVKKKTLKETAKDNAKTYKKQMEEIVKYTNQYRAQKGISRLKLDSKLTQAACHRSAEMAKAKVLSHQRPDGSTPWDLLDQYGITCQYTGENIAYTFGYGINAKQAAQMWYNSPGHRANMLNKNYGKIGVGIAVASDGAVYYTQLFTD